MPPADVIVLPLALMGDLDMEDGIVPGSYTPIGRVQVGLAVKAGAPHPDISTVPMLVAALKTAQAVMVNDPKGGSMQAMIIDAMLKRPDFAGVHGMSPAKGEGGQGAVARRRRHGAATDPRNPQPEEHPKSWDPLPAELGAYMTARRRCRCAPPMPRMLRPSSSSSPGPRRGQCGRPRGLNPF